MRITIKRTRSNLKFDLELSLEPPPSLAQLQRLIFKKSDIPEWAQRLFYQGRFLRGASSLVEQGVPTEGAVLLLTTSSHLVEELSKDFGISANLAQPSDASAPADAGGTASSSSRPPAEAAVPKSSLRHATPKMMAMAAPPNPGVATLPGVTPAIATSYMHSLFGPPGVPHHPQAASGGAAAASRHNPAASASSGAPAAKQPPPVPSGSTRASAPPTKAPPPQLPRMDMPVSGMPFTSTGGMTVGPAPMPMPGFHMTGGPRGAGNPQAHLPQQLLGSVMQQLGPQLMSQMGQSGGPINPQMMARMNVAVEQAINVGDAGGEAEAMNSVQWSPFGQMPTTMPGGQMVGMTVGQLMPSPSPAAFAQPGIPMGPGALPAGMQQWLQQGGWQDSQPPTQQQPSAQGTQQETTRWENWQ